MVNRILHCTAPDGRRYRLLAKMAWDKAYYTADVWQDATSHWFRTKREARLDGEARGVLNLITDKADNYGIPELEAVR